MLWQRAEDHRPCLALRLPIPANTVYNDFAVTAQTDATDTPSLLPPTAQTRSGPWRGLAPPLMTILAGVGFAAGVLVMVVGYGGGPSKDFIGKQETIAWIITVAFQVAFWAVASVALWSDVLKLRRTAGRREWLVLGLGVLAVFAIIGLPLFFTQPLKNPLLYARPRLLALQVVAGLLVLLPGLLAIWLLALAFARDDPLRDKPAAPPGLERVRAFLDQRAALLRSGSLLGATIGLATLASGALRNALIAADRDSFSATMVLAYGAFFTALLALVYVPAYQCMQSAGRRLLEAAAPEELPDSPTYGTYKTTRAAFEDVLQVKVGPADSFRIATAVLAPLVSGVITVLVGVSV